MKTSRRVAKEAIPILDRGECTKQFFKERKVLYFLFLGLKFQMVNVSIVWYSVGVVLNLY